MSQNLLRALLCGLVLLGGVGAKLGFVHAADVYWTGMSTENDDWDNPANWSSDPFVPGENDDVFHLVLGTIKVNVGTAANPVAIKSFTFDPAFSGGLVIQAGKGLKIAENLDKCVNCVGIYNVTVQDRAKLKVMGNIANAELSLEAAQALLPAWNWNVEVGEFNITVNTQGQPTGVGSVSDGVIGRGHWDIGPNTTAL